MIQSKVIQGSLKNFEVKENQLIIAGKKLTDWATGYGTPFYLYDHSIIRKKISLFRQCMPPEIKLFYAAKANPSIKLLKGMVGLVDGFDAASAGEIKAIITSGGNPETVSFAGPGKTIDELSYAVQVGIGSINIESERELELIAEVAKRQNKIPKISIRINPDFELHGSGVKMGGGAKQFGIDAERIPGLLGKISNFPVKFQGFHIYTGSQNLSADSITDVMEQSLKLCLQLAGEASESIRMLNLGGGFGIPYFNKDEELDISAIGSRLASLIQIYKPKFPNAVFVIELGRYLVGESGIYVTKILYKKKSRGKTFLITDGGMNHHLAASGNFGQVLRKNFPIIMGTNVSGSECEQVDVVGPLCTPLDLLGSKIDLPKSREGDLIVFMNSGAYGYSASPLLFLGHEPPREIFVQS
ncbi:MAG: pyridoxal-dependent decarboxylase, exosortase A system-associated [Desulfobacula sp.]|nr:pyridoxal-dependent decarboxylase, exosortase A system-associated [Desulfobacula sp.]